MAELDFGNSRVLVTGGLGFIARNFINLFSRRFPNACIVNLDAVFYCSSTEGIDRALRSPVADSQLRDPLLGVQYTFVKGDIRDGPLVQRLLREHQIDVIFHFAAFTHVGNCFEFNEDCVNVNVMGTATLLEEARKYGHLLRFVYISTDEVYGETDFEHPAEEDWCRFEPTTPYAASKTAADLLASSFFKSFQLPVVTVRPANVYGPGQHPEKVIPLFSTLLREGKKLTIQGTGCARRCFCHVEDTADAIITVACRGVVGEAYNIASPDELTIMELAEKCIAVWEERAEGVPLTSPQGFGERVVVPLNAVPTLAQKKAWIDKYIIFVQDRKYNDARYYISGKKLAALGWEPKRKDFFYHLRETINWYMDGDHSAYWGS